MAVRNVLITGASSGIGKAISPEFAKDKYNLILVAENAAGLSETANELRHLFEVEVIEITKDLTNENAPQEIYNDLQNRNIEIDVLVNDAGIGQKEKFHETRIEKDIEIIRLNIEALVRLTKLFLKDMVSRKSGKNSKYRFYSRISAGTTFGGISCLKSFRKFLFGSY